MPTPAGTPTSMAESWPLSRVIDGVRDTVLTISNGQAAVRAWADVAGARTAATLIEGNALGHAWSGGVANSAYSEARRPDTLRMAWAFAVKQFRPTDVLGA